MAASGGLGRATILGGGVVIFVTVGSVFPFDRLIRAMDLWAAKAGHEMMAQIGEGRYLPQHMRYARRLSQLEFARNIAGADLIVAHAGMGTVITAGRAGRPLVLLPRLQEAGEHTTDHQIATANWLDGKPGILVARSEADLPGQIAAALAGAGGPVAAMEPFAEAGFTDRLRGAILGFTQTRNPR